MSDDEKNVYQEKGLKLYEEYEVHGEVSNYWILRFGFGNLLLHSCLWNSGTAITAQLGQQLIFQPHQPCWSVYARPRCKNSRKRRTSRSMSQR